MTATVEVLGEGPVWEIHLNGEWIGQVAHFADGGWQAAGPCPATFMDYATRRHDDRMSAIDELLRARA